MTLRDLTQLKVGDILPIELSPQVPLCVENIPVFTGEFGIANGMNAVKITATHPPGTRPRVPVIQKTRNERYRRPRTHPGPVQQPAGR